MFRYEPTDFQYSSQFWYVSYSAAKHPNSVANTPADVCLQIRLFALVQNSRSPANSSYLLSEPKQVVNCVRVRCKLCVVLLPRQILVRRTQVPLSAALAVSSMLSLNRWNLSLIFCSGSKSLPLDVSIRSNHCKVGIKLRIYANG